MAQEVQGTGLVGAVQCLSGPITKTTQDRSGLKMEAQQGKSTAEVDQVLHKDLLTGKRCLLSQLTGLRWDGGRRLAKISCLGTWLRRLLDLHWACSSSVQFVPHGNTGSSANWDRFPKYAGKHQSPTAPLTVGEATTRPGVLQSRIEKSVVLRSTSMLAGFSSGRRLRNLRGETKHFIDGKLAAILAKLGVEESDRQIRDPLGQGHASQLGSPGLLAQPPSECPRSSRGQEVESMLIEQGMLS